MAAPTIPPIRLGLTGPGPAVEKPHWPALRRHVVSAFTLNPPMIMPSVSLIRCARRARPAARAGRCAPAVKGTFLPLGDVLKGTFRSFSVLKGPFMALAMSRKCPSQPPHPAGAHPAGARRALRARRPRSGRDQPQPTARARTSDKNIGGSRFTDFSGEQSRPVDFADAVLDSLPGQHISSSASFAA
jgi:hypothetical protein